MGINPTNDPASAALQDLSRTLGAQFIPHRFTPADQDQTASLIIHDPQDRPVIHVQQADTSGPDGPAFVMTGLGAFQPDLLNGVHTPGEVLRRSTALLEELHPRPEHLNFMIDLETLGTATNSLIWSIGVVPFSLNDGMFSHGPGLEILINPTLAQASGARFDAATVGWWMKKSPAAQERFHAALSSPHSEPDAIELLQRFMTHWGGNHSRTWQPWGNSTMFDISLLEHLCERHGLKVPWSFMRPRCYRTVTQIALANGWTCPDDHAGDAHNALDDAVTQVRRLQSACAHLGLNTLHTPDTPRPQAGR